ncbi:MAG TPA: hypothetical protein VKA68_15535 [bacterium]|nr:hypothetical protein [bacterium]
MKRVRFIHWNTEEARERAGRFDSSRYEVEYTLRSGPKLFRELKETQPDAIAIDLSRLPSQGRDVGLTLRKTTSTRHIPLLYIGGDTEKVERIRQLLPDAVYTNWEKINRDLKKAITHPPEDPVVPDSVFNGYAGTSLPKKLGIRENSRILLVDSPREFGELLDALPEDARMVNDINGKPDIIICFVESRATLSKRVDQLVSQADDASIWLSWPKKASGRDTDLSQAVVRQTGLSAGLVDYKICSIDETWSGLLFTRRKPA